MHNVSRHNTRTSAPPQHARGARVIINDRCLLRPPTGVGHYTRELLARLSSTSATGLRVEGAIFRTPPPLRHGQPLATPPPQRRAPQIPAPLRSLLDSAYALWFRTVAAARRCRLYHEPNHVPVPWPGPTITTIHDLSVLRFPHWHPAHRVRWYERGLARGLRQSCRLIAVSQFTRRELTDLLGVPDDRIAVIYPAARDLFRPLAKQQTDQTLRRLRLPDHFFLHVGTLEPRKNHDLLLQAYARLPADLRRRYPLVLVGPTGWGIDLAQALRRAALTPGDVRPLGYQPDTVLRDLYNRCIALLWPSLYEGFGLPPLECMACGRPAIVSDAASLPEVVADAAPRLDPHDLAGWAETIRRLIDDPDWREQLASRASARAHQFSWERCAAEHLALYQEVLAT